MKNKEILLLAIISLIISTPAFATVELDDINHAHSQAYRVGTSDDIEIKQDTIQSVDTTKVKAAKQKVGIEALTFADLSLKRISEELSQNLEMNYSDMISDLSVLWQGAATKSDIIKFALYKLSNPDADKPDDKSVKRVLQTIANMSTLIGAGAGDAVASGASFIGGNILGIMSEDDKTFNYKYTKVNDADMIILVRKIDDLQQKIMDSYFDYMMTRKEYQLTVKMTKDRAENYKRAISADNKELIIITDAYYREALDKELKARSVYYANRAKMEQICGNEAFTNFEQSVTAREKSDNN